MTPRNTYQSITTTKIDIRRLIPLIFSKWYLFAISIFIFLILGSYYLARKPIIYETNASILIRVQNSSPEEILILKELGMNMSGKSKRDNEIGILKSNVLVGRVVSSLELHTTYRRKNSLGFYTPELYKESPLYVTMQDVKPQDIPGPIEFIFTPTTSSAVSASSAKTTFNVQATYNLLGKKREKQLIVETLPTVIELEIGKFFITEQTTVPGTNRPIVFGNKPLRVTILNATEVTHSYINNLEVDNSIKSSSLLYITLKTKNQNKGEDFINALIGSYNRDAAKDKNISAYNTSLFIQERLKKVARELGEVESRVESFRQEYEVTDLEAQVGSYISRGEEYENRRMEIETQLNLVKFIEEYIKDPANNNYGTLPNLGINDASLVQLIDEYNNLLMQRARIESSTSAENPAFKEINKQVKILKDNIIISISNEVEASQIALDNLNKKDMSTGAKIDNVPTLERQFTSIEREQKVKSNLFKFLLQKREESNLTQAAISPKAKTIARPYTRNRAIAPRKSLILGVFFLVGLAFPAAFLFLRDYFQTKIIGPEELEKLVNSSVIGSIYKVKQKSIAPITSTYAQTTHHGYSLVVKPNDSSIVAEMFRTIRSNLLFMTHEREKNIILVTSTIPKEGKTYISVNLAQSLSLLDKKVLLIGADLRNPKTSHALGIPKRAVGLSSYLAGQVQDYHQLIESVDTTSATDNTKKGLYTIQAGTIPPNPNELLSGNKIGQLLEQVKHEFDYIIVDSAPVGVVSDTFLIARHTDATLFVIRENFSQKDTIQFINNITQDQRLKNVGVVLNQTNNKNNSHYGSTNHYSYKYNYQYGPSTN